MTTKKNNTSSRFEKKKNKNKNKKPRTYLAVLVAYETGPLRKVFDCSTKPISPQYHSDIPIPSCENRDVSVMMSGALTHKTQEVDLAVGSTDQPQDGPAVPPQNANHPYRKGSWPSKRPRRVSYPTLAVFWPETIEAQIERNVVLRLDPGRIQRPDIAVGEGNQC